MEKLSKLWVDFVIQSLMAPGYLCQLRKFVQGQTWNIPGDIWTAGECLTLEELDYTHKNKMRQLIKNYYNEESIKEANRKLISRFDGKKYQTSVAASTVGQAKRGDSQGHCIRSIVITHFTKSVAGEECITVDIFYRSTELIKKFGADIFFLNKFLIPELLKDVPYPIREVRFYFSNLFISSLFLPILYMMKPPRELLEPLRQNDPEFFKRCISQTKSLLGKNYNHYSFRTRREMHHLALDLMKEGVLDRQDFADYLINLGIDIPEDDNEGDEEEE